MSKRLFRVRIVSKNKLQKILQELEIREYQIKVQTLCIIQAEVLSEKLHK